MGYVGSDAHLRRIICCCKHILKLETGLYFLSQPIPRAITGIKLYHPYRIWWDECQFSFSTNLEKLFNYFFINFRCHSAGWSWIYSSLSLFLYSYYLHFLVVSTYGRRIQFIWYKVKLFQPDDLFHTKFYLIILILGANQLLWYYADLEKQKCYHSKDESGERIVATTALSEEVYTDYANSTSQPPKPDFPPPEINHCLSWRRFAK